MLRGQIPEYRQKIFSAAFSARMANQSNQQMLSRSDRQIAKVFGHEQPDRPQLRERVLTCCEQPAPPRRRPCQPLDGGFHWIQPDPVRRRLDHERPDEAPLWEQSFLRPVLPDQARLRLVRTAEQGDGEQPGLPDRLNHPFRWMQPVPLHGLRLFCNPPP